METTNVSMIVPTEFAPSWSQTRIHVRRLNGMDQVSGTSPVNSDGTGKTKCVGDQTLETVGAFACGQLQTLSLR